MANWTPAGSTSVSLVANPNKLAATGQQGALKIDYLNYSFVPLTMAIFNLRSSDPAVATSTPSTTPPPSINIPRRPNKRWANPPATGSKLIGTWSSVGQGSATLNADVDVQDRAGQRLSAVTPSEDVQVT